MHNRAFMKVALLGLLTLVLVPGFAAAASQGPEMLASTAAERAVAVSGPVISIAPLSHDYGIVNAGASASFDFTITNTGDADLHLTMLFPPPNPPRRARSARPRRARYTRSVDCRGRLRRR